MQNPFKKIKETVSLLPSCIDTRQIEITGKGTHKSALLCGVEKILVYGEKEMVFLFHGEKIAVQGDNLNCAAYRNGAIEVVGHIENVSFEDGRGKRK